jgi:hypothetical protein
MMAIKPESKPQPILKPREIAWQLGGSLDATFAAAKGA